MQLGNKEVKLPLFTDDMTERVNNKRKGKTTSWPNKVYPRMQVFTFENQST